MEEHLLINGQMVLGEGAVRHIVNPASEETIVVVREASVEQVEQAIQAARNAFDATSWKTDKEERVRLLLALAQKLELQCEEIAILESKNTGKPFREAKIDVEDSVNCLKYYADLIERQKKESLEQWDGSTSVVQNVPYGVVALIVPWNFPLLLGIWKLAPALAAGNTIVFKPSELTPLTMIKLAELTRECGFPAGVFNLVPGDGPSVGQTLVTSGAVDKVSFTGGTVTGRLIHEHCAKSFKRVSLELGGKSPMLVFSDVPLDEAVEWALFGSFFNQGEVCVASSRILVEETIYQTFVEKLVARARTIKLGDPLKEETEMGPLISKVHLEKVESYIEIGEKEGARRQYGGERIGQEGYFVTPVIFTDVTPEMTIVQEEIFGPFSVIQSFNGEEEAIKLANGTKYALAAGILSNDLDRANRVAERIQAGTIWINSYHTPFVNAPWGGFKQSGIGRELGPQGLASYSEPKHVNVTKKLGQLGWYSM